MMIAFCLVCGLALALLPHLIWFLGWVIARIAGGHLPYHCFGWSALGLVLVFWGLMAYGYFIGRWNLEVTHLDYIHEDIPEAFEGFKTIHRGDLQADSSGTDGFRVLLSHDPSHWSGEVVPHTDIPLTLARSISALAAQPLSASAHDLK